MITLKNIELDFHGEALYSDVSLDIFNGHRIGLVGANGTGKSSLMAIINGELSADKGDLNIARDLRIAIMRQTMPDTDTTALDYVLQGHHEYVQAQRQLKQAYEQEQDEKIIECLALLDDINAYHLEALAATILHGLGFGNHETHKPVKTFSGGWRMRLQLAQALLKPSDIMLLDEPTNHLDIAAITWLEQFLTKYQGAVVLISHDRVFLDNTCNYIWHIEHKKIKAYKGSYSDFERLRAEHIKAQQALSEKQQRAIAHMQSFVDRFRAKATKAKQAQSRIKALEKIETIQVLQDKTAFSFEFKTAEDISNPAMRLEDFAVGYEQPVLRIGELTINKGDRIGLLGVNGAGKSTLMKTLAGTLTALNGTLMKSPKLNLGYYAQDQVELLRFDQTPAWHILQRHPQWSEQLIRNFLGGFNFCGDKALTCIERFSGGEQSRLVLAILASLQCNMLLLDEPTNHLDMEMRNALVLSMQEFNGSFIMISHDRYLLESCCDAFWLVDDGGITLFKGDMDDYQQWLTDKAQSQQKQSKKVKKDKPLSVENTTKLEKQVKSLEQKIEKVNQKIAVVDDALKEPELYQEETGQNKASQLRLEKTALVSELDGLQDQWFEALHQLENMD